jgi:hypothetical protein
MYYPEFKQQDLDIQIYCIERKLEEISNATLKKGKSLAPKLKFSFDTEEKEFKVLSSAGDQYYFIDFDFDEEDGFLFLSCDCPALSNYGECKHEVALLLNLKAELEALQQNQSNRNILQGATPQQMQPSLDDNKDAQQVNQDIILTLDEPSLSSLMRALRQVNDHKRPTATNINCIRQLVKINNTMEVNVAFSTAVHQFKVMYNGASKMQFICSCRKHDCKGVKILAAYIEEREKSWIRENYTFTQEKQEIANRLGIALDHPLIQQIKFSIDSWFNTSYALPASMNAGALPTFFSKKKANVSAAKPAHSVVIAFNFGTHGNIKPFALQAHTLKQNGDIGSSTIGEQNLWQDQFDVPLETIDVLKKISKTGLIRVAHEKGWSRHINEYSADPFYYMDNEFKETLRLFIVNTLIVNRHCFNNITCYINPSLNDTKISNYKKVTVSANSFDLHFNINDQSNMAEVAVKVVLPDISIADDALALNGFVYHQDVLYFPKDYQTFQLLNYFKEKQNYLPKKGNEERIKFLIEGLVSHYSTTLNDKEVPVISITEKPQYVISISEEAQTLFLAQEVHYGDLILDPYDDTANRYFDRDIIYETVRDLNFETEKRNLFQQLHPSFINLANQTVSISFAEAKKDLWFINSMQLLIEHGFILFGWNKLKNFNVNPHKPKWEMQASSGVDWFDLNVVVSFGDEQAKLSEIRKAIMDGTQYVKLGDGTIGMLPAEWIKKYGMVMQMGAVDGGQIRMSKLHFSLINQFYDEIDDEAVQKELNDKKKKLQGIENVKTKPVSKKINATLRDYQLHGYKWLQVLEDMGWGACLADDMGLGKTLQAITFLQFLKEKHKGDTCLVVCPTSLIYNWQSELDKYAPSINYYIHYGVGRAPMTDELKAQYNLIITTYGMIRSDIEDFKKLHFRCIILDESQAIKNPVALITKAVQVLQANTRLILSGTPLQNNTMDLYAQFQFVNKGLLGSADVFRQNFATPIDKENDAEASKQLRELLYPFILRRTKEQVAKELPDKIESILWCEMNAKQRKVYNEYKEHYRDLVLGKIDQMGMAKASMYVLEGLLRLRQICDSPVLVKNPKVLSTDSIKLQELMREIQENTGTNKVLVFSQFTEMLALAKQELDKQNMAYCYLDGSTKADQRKEAVHQFQTNDDIKIFLLSIKAGGVGLNLTKASYVYLLDPWWNPAVEQQAIDRAHRIGQTNKIFAYKMICKDSVEERIVELQNKKKQIANELISEDAGFVKKLTRDDVAFLFA